MPHSTLAPFVRRAARASQMLWNLGCAGLALLALPLVCCALMHQLRARGL